MGAPQWRVVPLAPAVIEWLKEFVPADAWPAILEKVMAAQILVIGTPIWLGEKSSVCTQVVERLYSASGQLNAAGQYASTAASAAVSSPATRTA